MAKPKIIKLKRGESIVAVVPERCAGPGWSNAPTWVYIQGFDGIRRECIQPAERAPGLHALFLAGEAMAVALIGSVPTRVCPDSQAAGSGR